MWCQAAAEMSTSVLQGTRTLSCWSVTSARTALPPESSQLGRSHSKPGSLLATAGIGFYCRLPTGRAH